jgi:hypothetical protein
LPKRNNWVQWIGLRENWQENLQLIDADFFSSLVRFSLLFATFWNKNLYFAEFWS